MTSQSLPAYYSTLDVGEMASPQSSYDAPLTLFRPPSPLASTVRVVLLSYFEVSTIDWRWWTERECRCGVVIDERSWRNSKRADAVDGRKGKKQWMPGEKRYRYREESEGS